MENMMILEERVTTKTKAYCTVLLEIFKSNYSFHEYIDHGLCHSVV
jgi:hypothetical protein